MYQVQTSTNTSVGSEIYGWWYSIPCLILITIIILIAVIGMIVISRPALGADSQRDAAARITRVHNILAASAGGLLLSVLPIRTRQANKVAMT